MSIRGLDSITDDPALARAVLAEIKRQLPLLATAGVAEVAWARRGEVAVCASIDDCIDYSDHVGPEHLQVHTKDPDAVGARLRNYGSLFIGVEASVVYSDKIARDQPHPAHGERRALYRRRLGRNFP